MRTTWFLVHALGWMSVVGLFAWLWFHDPLLTAKTARREDQTILRNRVYRIAASGTAKLDIYLPPNRTVPAAPALAAPGPAFAPDPSSRDPGSMPGAPGSRSASMRSGKLLEIFSPVRE